MNGETEQKPASQAERVIARFGGIRKLQRALGHKSPTTVQGWKERGRIPSGRQDEVLRIGQMLNPPLTPADFFDAPNDAPVQDEAA